MKLFGAKMVPRNHSNKNMPHKNNDFMLFLAVESIENSNKNTRKNIYFPDNAKIKNLNMLNRLRLMEV